MGSADALLPPALVLLPLLVMQLFHSVAAVVAVTRTMIKIKSSGGSGQRGQLGGSVAAAEAEARQRRGISAAAAAAARRRMRGQCGNGNVSTATAVAAQRWQQ